MTKKINVKICARPEAICVAAAAAEECLNDENFDKVAGITLVGEDERVWECLVKQQKTQLTVNVNEVVG